MACPIKAIQVYTVCNKSPFRFTGLIPFLLALSAVSVFSFLDFQIHAINIYQILMLGDGKVLQNMFIQGLALGRADLCRITLCCVKSNQKKLVKSWKRFFFDSIFLKKSEEGKYILQNEE